MTKFSWNFLVVQKKSIGWGHNLLLIYYKAFKEYEDFKTLNFDQNFTFNMGIFNRINRIDV